jgi:uncharacterized membrane protein
MSTRKIDAWHAAGLLDDAARARLLAYEAENSRPLALWAVFGIGALAIGLGLISVVAANWEAIPGQIRLCIHLALILAALAALLLREQQLGDVSPWAAEALLFITGLLGLTFFGHLGQVYQTSSPLWQPIATWWVLFAPLLLLLGRSWLTAALVVGSAIYGVWDYAIAADAYAQRADAELPDRLRIAFITTIPAVSAPLGAWLRGRSERPQFWRRLEQLGLAYVVGGASLSFAAVSLGHCFCSPVLNGEGQFLRAIIALVVGLFVVFARPGVSGRVAGAIIACSGLVMTLAFATNETTAVAGALFMALWAGIAAAALVAGWRGVFQLAIAAIAFRLIILSFELGSDLLLSGFGLILSGLMIIGIAWIAVQVSRTFAPPVEYDESVSP